MPEMNFSTGLVSYTINGNCEVSFNPTDNNFVERLYDTFTALDKKQEAYRDAISKMADKKEIFSFARERDAEMREMIDGIFGAPVCASLFGDMSTYALAEGLPVWANFLLAVMDTIDTAFTREQKTTNPHLKKYLDRYAKK